MTSDFGVTAGHVEYSNRRFDFDTRHMVMIEVYRHSAALDRFDYERPVYDRNDSYRARLFLTDEEYKAVRRMELNGMSNLRAFLIALMLLVFAAGLAFLLYPSLWGAAVDQKISLNAQGFLNRDATEPTIPEVIVTIDSLPAPTSLGSGQSLKSVETTVVLRTGRSGTSFLTIIRQS